MFLYLITVSPTSISLTEQPNWCTTFPILVWFLLLLNIPRQQFVASVLECSIYHCTRFEKNEFEIFGILILDLFFIRDLRSIPVDENIPIQIKLTLI